MKYLHQEITGKLILPVLVIVTSFWLGASLVWLELPVGLLIGGSVILLLLIVADQINLLAVNFHEDKVKLYMISVILNIIGLSVAYFVAFGFFLAVLSALALIYLRLFLFNKFVLVDRIIISIIFSGAFVAGGLTSEIEFSFGLNSPLFPAIMAFIFSLGYGLIDEARQTAEQDANQPPLITEYLSIPQTVAISFGLFFLMTLLSYWPILTGWFGDWYKIILIYIVELPLLGFLILLWGNPELKLFRAALIIMKINILLSLTAFILA